MKRETWNILIAGGGTGGHLFPAMAVAEEIETMYPSASITFVGTVTGLESRVIPLTIWNLVTMDIPKLKGISGLRKLRTMIFMPRSFVQAWKILKEIKPDVVIGVGGYAAGPITLVASLRGIPTAAMEQNAIAGVTNRILGHFVKKVFVSFEESAKYFSKNKVIFSGNPVRRKIRESVDHRPLKRDGFTLLIFGGSQGARFINEKMVEALSYLEDVKEDLHIIHQIGRAEDTEKFSATYRARGFSAEIYHFIENMGKAYSGADMVICRAGATSVAELSVARKPTIFIPYRFAADNHQEANARVLVEAGAAVMIREENLTGENLAGEIKEMIADPLKLASMAEAMKKHSRPDAARIVVEECMRLVR